jgi:hypothetical protein
MRHKDIKATSAKEGNGLGRWASRDSTSPCSPEPPDEPTPVVDAEIVQPSDKTVSTVSKPNELEELLMQHARDAAGLGRVVARFEREWLDFLASADPSMVPTALGLAAKIDKLRAGLADETMRVAEIVHDLPRSKMSFTIRDSAVLVAPNRRERDKAE